MENKHATDKALYLALKHAKTAHNLMFDRWTELLHDKAHVAATDMENRLVKIIRAVTKLSQLVD